MAKVSGLIIVDGIEVAATRQCVHCGGHFVSVKGSGITRGFCRLCKGITCGSHSCDACIPFEKQLDMVDGG